MKRPRLNVHGFTLVELLIAMVVTGLVMGVLTDYLLTNFEQSMLAGIRASALEQTESGLDLVANDIRLSANADENNRWADPNSPGGSGNEYDWTSNSSTLVLAAAAQSSSGSIIFSDPEDYITEKNNIVFFVSHGTLYKRIIAAPVSGNAVETTCPAADASGTCPADAVILNNVTAFTVTYLNGNNDSVTPTDARSIQLQVTVSKSMYNHTISSSYTTQMVFRND